MTTTSALTQPDILILYQWTVGHSPVLPVLTNASGKDDRDINFVVDVNENEVQNSCSLTYRGEHYVLGGINYPRQIAKIVGCALKNVGELSFYYTFGGCANMVDSRVYLCFHIDPSSHKKCYVAPSPLSQFEQTTSSYENHANTRIAASDSEL